ncbi:MAG: transglycosylase domain-containing protein [Saprospirales bacterium]|nr:transglycosylase domain-containing protein [Saprospirales bacterium]
MPAFPENDLSHILFPVKEGWRSRWKRFWKRHRWLKRSLVAGGLLGFLGILAMAGLLLSVYWGAFGKLPTQKDLGSISHFLASEVYTSDSILLGRYYFENRSDVRFEEISPNMVNALVATEDARFFEHWGVDLRAWGRVFFKSVVRGDRSSGGGSTLSQQLAKNLYPREDFGAASLLINKLREVLIALRLEQLYSKNQLLELYLNTVPFSENTYGVKVAAHRFFNTTPAQLTPEQSAVLVAMLKATTSFNPMTQPERALQRRNWVIQQMVKNNYLDAAIADSLQQEPICLEYTPLHIHEGLAPHFREFLRLEMKQILKDLRKPNGMPYNLYTDGLKIYTSIDPQMQRYAEEAMHEHMDELQQAFTKHLKGQDPWETPQALDLAIYHSARYRSYMERGLCEEEIDSLFAIPVDMQVFSRDKLKENRKMSPMDSIKYYLGLLNAGFLAVEPETGAIRAWVGGIDHQYFQYDHVRSKRQVGSTFKPIVYAKAIQAGIPPCSYTANVLRTYSRYENWQPKNSDEKYGGFYSMEGGLIYSINTVTVNLAMRAGPKAVAELARQMGISSEVPAVPAIALGAVDASLLDMAKVYSVFANRGVRPEFYFIRRVETREGEVLVDFEKENDPCEWEQVLTMDQADMLTQMLRAAVDRGTGRRLRYRYGFKNDIAGKTGTSQNQSDGWFIGYNPELVAGVWVGAESPGVRFRSLELGQGANMALPIYALFLKKLNADPDYRHITQARFPQPTPEVVQALNCPNRPVKIIPDSSIPPVDTSIPESNPVSNQ